MSDTIDIRVPDIGDFKDVPVIEVLVRPGQYVSKETPLVVLESEKASMDVPSSADGTVQEVKVRVGDRVSKDTVILTLAAATAAPPKAEPPPAMPASAAKTIDLVVPDIGDFKNVPVVEVLVRAGQRIEKEAPLLVLESEKASMEVPASAAGTISEVRVKPGDSVSQGSVIATLTGPSGAPVVTAPPSIAAASAAPPSAETAPIPEPEIFGTEDSGRNGSVHASPAIRRFARELGVDLRGLSGSGPRGRITREDVQGFVKAALQRSGGSGADAAFGTLPAWPKVDFAQYGAVERQPLPRIKKLSGPNLHRNWVRVPHITNYDEADVTELEAFRSRVNAEQAKGGGPKLTMLAFLVKACVAALQRFPEFNASLEGDELIYKRYYNIGFAADTEGGLVVPVVAGADGKGLLTIAAETAQLAAKARDNKLSMREMQGGTFTISSIGGIGGTAFTQIVNAPEVAILGAVRTAIRPVWNGGEFVARTMLPISVSYDHRVIDGAGAARFLNFVASLLTDFTRVTL